MWRGLPLAQVVHSLFFQFKEKRHCADTKDGDATKNGKDDRAVIEGVFKG